MHCLFKRLKLPFGEKNKNKFQRKNFTNNSSYIPGYISLTMIKDIILFNQVDFKKCASKFKLLDKSVILKKSKAYLST